MIKYLIPKEGQFYKANMHAHTVISDGRLTPEEMKRIYKSKGYSILAYTDHEVMVPHPELADEDFLPINSYELSIVQDGHKWSADVKCYHLNFYSPAIDMTLTKTFCPCRVQREHSKAYVTEEMRSVGMKSVTYSRDFVQKLIDIATEEGFLVCYNHPVWSLQNHEDYSGLKGLWGVEWFNYANSRSGYYESMQPITDLLNEGNRMVYPIAADDSHSEASAFGGFINVKARTLTYDDVFEALRKGEFYSSNGPELYELYIDNGVLHLRCSAAKSVLVTSDRRFAVRRDAAKNEYVNEAEIDISKYLEICRQSSDPSSGYIRIDVEDEYGKVARSRAYFIDELV